MPAPPCAALVSADREQQTLIMVVGWHSSFRYGTMTEPSTVRVVSTVPQGTAARSK